MVISSLPLPILTFTRTSTIVSSRSPAESIAYPPNMALHDRSPTQKKRTINNRAVSCPKDCSLSGGQCHCAGCPTGQVPYPSGGGCHSPRKPPSEKRTIDERAVGCPKNCPAGVGGACQCPGNNRPTGCWPTPGYPSPSGCNCPKKKPTE